MYCFFRHILVDDSNHMLLPSDKGAVRMKSIASNASKDTMAISFIII
jgi:hypothetical protein